MTPQRTVHIVGFGSQGSAWTQCLRRSGWKVHVYLNPSGKNFQLATQLGFEPQPIESLPSQLTQEREASNNDEAPLWIAMMCPDSATGPLYTNLLSSLPLKLRLILAHGFTLYSGELKLQHPEHHAVLLAPKAIGPQLLKNFLAHFPEPHSLYAAYAPGTTHATLEIARGLGFAESSLIPATFEQETIGDLISEQGLLCGGVFNLLEWTMEAMTEAGIPDALIREECITELELVAGLIRDRGPALAFQAISQAAQCGTIAMAQRLENSEFKTQFKAQMKSIMNQSFSQFFQSQDWQAQAKDLTQRLTLWQKRFAASKGEPSISGENKT